MSTSESRSKTPSGAKPASADKKAAAARRGGPPAEVPNPFAAMQFVKSCAALPQLPQDGVAEIAFAGRSNAGKSSALNALCAHRQLARVSKTPGRTQLINLFESPLGRLVDLPGYGYAKVPMAVRKDWGVLIGGYLEERENLRALVLIMDIRHPLTDFDQQLLSWAAPRGLPVHAVLTKADKLSFGATQSTLLAVGRALQQWPLTSVQSFSAQTRQGVEALREHLAQILRDADLDRGPTAED